MPETRTGPPLNAGAAGHAAQGAEQNLSALPEESAAVSVEREDDTILIRLSGSWSLDAGLASIADPERELTNRAAPRRVIFDMRELGAWDNAL
jgi:hypothetical protein